MPAITAPKNSATANGVWSCRSIVAKAWARAMPIDTAVTAMIRQHERHGGKQFNAKNAAARYSFGGNGGRITDLPGQLSHDLSPSRISALCCPKVAQDFGEAIEK